jgi:hypothetical protein
LSATCYQESHQYEQVHNACQACLSCGSIEKFNQVSQQILGALCKYLVSGRCTSSVLVLLQAVIRQKTSQALPITIPEVYFQTLRTIYEEMFDKFHQVDTKEELFPRTNMVEFLTCLAPTFSDEKRLYPLLLARFTELDQVRVLSLIDFEQCPEDRLGFMEKILEVTESISQIPEGLCQSTLPVLVDFVSQSSEAEIFPCLPGVCRLIESFPKDSFISQQLAFLVA